MQKRLTNKQWRFVDARARDPRLSHAECAVIAGYSKARSAKTASELMQNSLVVEEIEKMRQPVVKKMGFDYQDYYKELTDLKDRAKREGNLQVEHQVLRTVGEVSGVFVKRVLEKRVDAGDPKNMSKEEVSAEINRMMDAMGMYMVKKEKLKLLVEDKEEYLKKLTSNED